MRPISRVSVLLVLCLLAFCPGRVDAHGGGGHGGGGHGGGHHGGGHHHVHGGHSGGGRVNSYPPTGAITPTTPLIPGDLPLNRVHRYIGRLLGRPERW